MCECFNFRTQVLNNAALCCLKLEEFDLALFACGLVLVHVLHEDDKAAFRAALAAKHISDGKAAGVASTPEVLEAGRQAATDALSKQATSGSMHDGVGALLRCLKDTVQTHMPAESKPDTTPASAAEVIPAASPPAPAPVSPQAALKVSMLTSSAVGAALGGNAWSVHR